MERFSFVQHFRILRQSSQNKVSDEAELIVIYKYRPVTNQRMKFNHVPRVMNDRFTDALKEKRIAGFSSSEDNTVLCHGVRLLSIPCVKIKEETHSADNCHDSET